MMVSMNKLSTERRAQILGMMVEGNSIRAIVRMTGASRNTIVKLLEDAGEAFWLMERPRLLPVRRRHQRLDPRPLLIGENPLTRHVPTKSAAARRT
jgi:hypothetical protein